LIFFISKWICAVDGKINKTNNNDIRILGFILRGIRLRIVKILFGVWILEFGIYLVLGYYISTRFLNQLIK